MVEYTDKNQYKSSLFLIYFKIIEVVGKGILLKPTTSVPFELSTLRDKIFLPIHYLLSLIYQTQQISIPMSRTPIRDISSLSISYIPL
tara:strand:+ start:168 stop:431 length:264 start_codon:yes stop_codon:yes gene_type:complete